MKWYFEDIKNQRRLKKSLDSWIGTPHMHRVGVKGKGVDCIHFVGCVMVEVGAVQNFYIQDYDRDWHLHRGEQLLYNGLLGFDSLVSVGFHSPMNGDIILFQYGRAAAHSSIYYDGEIYQALFSGVEKRHWLDEHQRKKYGFRIKCL